MGLALRSTISSAIAFEDSFAGVRKTVDATEPQFRVLANGFRQLSREIPISVDEINRIGEAAGQLGVQRSAILDFTRTVADLGATTNLASDQAADGLARLANITGLPQSEFDRLGSALVDLGNKLAATESEILNFGLRIAGAGRQVGLTEADILAIGGAFSSVGVEAERGGTAVSKVLLQMNTAVISGTKELKGFAAVAGQSVGEFRKAFEQDAGEAFRRFVIGLDQIRKGGGDTRKVLNDLGLTDSRLVAAFQQMAAGNRVLTQALDDGQRAFKENTALTVEAQKRYETTASKLKIFRNRVNDLQITIGNLLVPVLEDVVRPLSDWLDSTENQEKVQRKLSRALKDAKDIISGVTAVILPLVKAGKDAAEALGGMRQAAQLFVAALVVSKVIGFTGAVTGLGTEALTTAGRVRALRTALLRLGAIGVITLGVEILLNKKQISDSVDSFLREHNLDFLTGPKIKIPAEVNAADLRAIRAQIADVKGESDLMVKALDEAIRKLDKAGRTGLTDKQQLLDLKGRPDRKGARDRKADIQKQADEQIDVTKALADASKKEADAAEKARRAAERAAEKAREAFEGLMDSLDLRLDKAQVTKSFADDLRVLADMQRAIEKRIAAEGRTTELERRLFEIQQERIEIRRQQREQAAEEDRRKSARLQRKQFALLGLDETGAERVPGVKALRRQFENIGSILEGTFLDTKKTRSVMSSIRKLLSGQLGKLGEDVRRKIQEILRDLNDQLKSNERKQGALTKTRVVDPTKLIRGLGLDLSQEEIESIRALMLRTGAGRLPGKTQPGAFGLAVGGAPGSIVITGPVNVTANNPDAFMRALQNRAKRSAASRRGRHSGKNLGLG